MKNQTTALPQYNPSSQMRVVLRQSQLTPGMRVKVNNHPATILRVITHVESYDAFQHRQHLIPLLHPIYELEVDRSIEYRAWHERQVYIPPQASILKLFADEFGSISASEPLKNRAKAC